MPMSSEEIMRWAESRVVFGFGIDILKNDCEIIEFALDNCEIDLPPQNRFFVQVNCGGISNIAKKQRMSRFDGALSATEFSDGVNAMAYTGYYDFSHTSAEWQSVINLGIYGLRNRISAFAEKNSENEKSKAFYRELLRVYDAALRFIKRASAKAASCGRNEMAKSLSNLSERSPSNLFEALQTSIIYYFLQYFFESTYLRTLGRVDQLYYPFYTREDKRVSDEMILDYIKEIDRLEAPANIPFAIGGTDADGRDLINELSYVWLNNYRAAETTNTKLHLLCSDNTPTELLRLAFRHIRDGSNSIVFVSDKRVIEALKKQGAEHNDAVNYHVVGCYECGAEGELTCSCNARVNIPKALELALNGGRDMLTGKPIGLSCSDSFESFDALYAEFERQLAHLCKCAMAVTDIHETRYPQIHSSPFLSGTYASALARGGDLYLGYTAKYNSSSLNAIGLATATDSLAAIRKAVFEDKAVTLGEFAKILRSNWAENEYLRLLIKNKYPKFGQGDPKTDGIATKIVDALSDTVTCKPNVKGGKWRLGLFSINWRWEMGENTAASADGRMCGEPLSQNTSASFGADKEGATAHLISVARLDTSKTPNGAIVDIDLHSSLVRGENGLAALVNCLKTYFELGGFAVHYNILDTEILSDARKHPEKYPTLQVRLCGWNVLFASLTEAEKDEFIARSMK